MLATRLPRSRIRGFDALIVVAAMASAGGCLTPGATGPSAQPASERPREDPSIVLWDGSRTPWYQLGRFGAPRFWDGGGGWAVCDAKPTCVATLGVVDGAGLEGDRGLRFHGEGPGWIGAAWNWASWRPNLARDLTAFTRLTFQIRLQDSDDRASGAGGVTIALSSRGSDGTSDAVEIKDYEVPLLDGRWHKVSIPLSALTQGQAGRRIDLSAVQELRISTWSAHPRRFDLCLDQIVAER
jgi:hypothetical protein